MKELGLDSKLQLRAPLTDSSRGLDVGAASAGGSPSTFETLARLKQRLQKLPVLPGTVVRLLHADSSSPRYFDDVVRVVGSDPGYATRVLALTNAAANVGRTRVTRIRDAVARLGTRDVVNLILAVSASAVFMPRAPWQKALWCHSITTAVIAQRLARLNPAPWLDPDELYLAGLLHDVGRFVLYLEAPEALRAVDETDWETPSALNEAEKTICGFTHAELGFLATAKWKLSQELCLVIRHHHDPLDTCTHPRIASMVKAVRVADWISIALLGAGDWRALDAAGMRAVLSRAPLPAVSWTERALAEIRRAMDLAFLQASALGL